MSKENLINIVSNLYDKYETNTDIFNKLCNEGIDDICIPSMVI